MRVYSGTDVGRCRDENQDYVFVSETPVGNLPNLFVVADGMGGHRGGAVASSLAVNVLVDTVRENADYNPVKVIRYGIEEANRRILREAEASWEHRGMGTTMVVATVVGRYLYVANVGDSRLYVSGDEILQITRDHSLVQEMVRLGGLTEEDARNHPDRNIITRALGADYSIDVDFFDMGIDEGSIILMCSDGLSNMLKDREMKEILDRKADLEEKGQALLELANEHGGRDNITIVLIEPVTEEVRKC